MAHASAITNQDGFRGRNDDGSEAAATWKAALNTDWTQGVGENFRVRFLITETGGGAVNNLRPQLEYNLNGAGWNPVNGASAVVRSFASPNFADDDNTTQQLGAGTFISPNSGMDEDNGLAGELNDMDFGGNDESEAEFCCQIIGADVVDSDLIDLRVTNQGVALTNYNQTPTITVSEAGGVVSFDGVCNTVTTGAAELAVKRAFTAAGDTIITAAAALAVKRALDGTGPTVTTGAASLNRRVALSGTCATETTGAAELTISGKVSLDGICATQSGGAGELRVKRALDGTGAVITTGAGDLAVKRALDAACDTLTGGSAALDRRPGLDGTGAVVSTGAASLNRRVALSGTCATETTGAAELTIAGRVALDGICATQSGGAGNLHVKRSLAGAGAVVTTGAAALDRRPGFAAVVATLSGAVANFNIRRGLDGQLQVITGGSASLACRRNLAATCNVLTTGAGELSVVQTVASFPIGTVLVQAAIISEVSAMEAVSLTAIEARRAVSGEAAAVPAVTGIIDARVQG